MHDFITAPWSLHSAFQTKAYHCNCTKQGGLVPPAFIYSRLKKWTWHCACHYVGSHLSIHSLKDWAFCPHAHRHVIIHIFLCLQLNCNYHRKKNIETVKKKKEKKISDTHNQTCRKWEVKTTMRWPLDLWERGQISQSASLKESGIIRNSTTIQQQRKDTRQVGHTRTDSGGESLPSVTLGGNKMTLENSRLQFCGRIVERVRNKRKLQPTTRQKLLLLFFFQYWGHKNKQSSEGGDAQAGRSLLKALLWPLNVYACQ